MGTALPVLKGETLVRYWKPAFYLTCTLPSFKPRNRWHSSKKLLDLICSWKWELKNRTLVANVIKVRFLGASKEVFPPLLSLAWPGNDLPRLKFRLFRRTWVTSPASKAASTLRLRNLKTEVSLWKRIKCFRPYYVRKIWKPNNQRSFGVWVTLGQGNHMIVVTSSFSSFVFKMFSLHTKTQSRRFRDGLVWTEDLTEERKLRFIFLRRGVVNPLEMKLAITRICMEKVSG